MEKIRAKAVSDDFWILQKDDVKVGQIKVTDKNIEVRIHGTHAGEFNSLDEIKESGLFEFTELPNPRVPDKETVHGYPTDGEAFNAVWNVQYGLPLYTQTEDSKSWFAAGYYKLNINGTWIVKFCPKLITLQRNEYKGPYDSDPSLTQFNKIFE